MTLTLRLETLVLPLRDPFVIARASHGEGRTITTVLAELLETTVEAVATQTTANAAACFGARVAQPIEGLS